MSRYGNSTQGDIAQTVQGDAAFIGVNAKLSPEMLPDGFVVDAVNMTFENSTARTRAGSVTPVSHTLTGTFALNGFVLFMCLDETGSIGIGGAQRGLDIIAAFRNAVGDTQIRGIGYVSFGDIICEIYPITDDLDAVVTRLQAVVDSGGSDPVFFQDNGGDTPENGVDALQVAIDQLAASSVAQAAQFRYIYLKTDTLGFAHNAADPATVLSTLESNAISRTWLEFGDATDGSESGLYADTFPESAKIRHDDFDPTDAPSVTVNVTAVYGSGIFSDPYGVEWMLVASNAGVHQLRDGHTPRLIATPEVMTGPVEFVQAFNVVLLFRGEDRSDGTKTPPWRWSGVRGDAFETINQSDSGDGTSPIPNAKTAELVSNRLLVPYGRDNIAVSDILNYTRYDAALDDFNVNTGSEDVLVRLFAFTGTTVLVFKSQSLLALNNVTGDLSSVALQVINSNLGCVAAKSVATLGGDVLFLSATGVFRVQQIVQARLETAPLPVSDPIEPIIRRINWLAASGAHAIVHGRYYYLAVPLDGAARNNAVLVFNASTESWEGVHTFPEGVHFDRLHLTDWNFEKRVFAVDDAARRVHLLYEGRHDIIDGIPAEIPASVLTRGFALGEPGQKRFRRMRMRISTWNPTVSATLQNDGQNDTLTVVDGQVKSRTRYNQFAKPPFVLTNVNNDHAAPGREDYSVQASDDFQLGSSGICFERTQSTQETQASTMTGRFCQILIRNTSGLIAIHQVEVEGAAADRSDRPKIL